MCVEFKVRAVASGSIMALLPADVSIFNDKLRDLVGNDQVVVAHVVNGMSFKSVPVYKSFPLGGAMVVVCIYFVERCFGNLRW